MTKLLIAAAAFVLAVHGLIHLMGTAVYMRFTELDGLRYKTTILAGRVDLGERGTMFFGAAFALTAVGFVIAAIAIVAGWSWSQPVLVAATLLSLVVTGLDWSVAFRGTIFDLTILAIWAFSRFLSA